MDNVSLISSIVKKKKNNEEEFWSCKSASSASMPFHAGCDIQPEFAR